MPAGVFIARILTLASYSLETCMQQFTQLCAGTSRNDAARPGQYADWSLTIVRSRTIEAGTREERT
jgi:hypothetical protein